MRLFNPILATALGVALVAVLVLSWLYRGARSDLAEERAARAVAESVSKANAEAVTRLERSISNTERALLDTEGDKATLAQVRNTVRQAVKEGMRDEVFKTWAAVPVPADGLRMLIEAHNTSRKDALSADPAVQPAAGLRGNATSGKRSKQR